MRKTDKLLFLDTPWAIGEDKYRKILEVLSSRKIERIVEFGSGRSTVRLCQDLPEADIVSIEHHEEFYKQTIELLRQHRVKNALVLHSPLKRRRFGLRSYVTYDLQVDQLDSDVDFVLIDGPVESETLRGREPPLYMVFPLLKVGGLIALDDYHRESAKAVVKNWLNSYAENLQVLREYDGLILLEKCGEQSQPAYPGIHSIQDNLYANVRLGLRRLRMCINSVMRILK